MERFPVWAVRTILNIGRPLFSTYAVPGTSINPLYTNINSFQSHIIIVIIISIVLMRQLRHWEVEWLAWQPDSARASFLPGAVWFLNMHTDFLNGLHTLLTSFPWSLSELLKVSPDHLHSTMLSAPFFGHHQLPENLPGFLSRQISFLSIAV